MPRRYEPPDAVASSLRLNRAATRVRFRLLLRSEAVRQGLEYLQRVSRIGDIAARHAFDVVIALLVVAGMLELILGRDSPDAPRSTLWFTVPAIGLLVL